MKKLYLALALLTSCSLAKASASEIKAEPLKAIETQMLTKAEASENTDMTKESEDEEAEEAPAKAEVKASEDLELKIAKFDPTELFKGSLEMRDATQKLRKKFGTKLENVARRMQEIQEEQDGSTPPDAATREEFQKLYEQRMKLEQKAQAAEMEARNSFFQHTKKAVDQVRKEAGLSLLDEIGALGSIDKNYDLTSKVLKKLNDAYKAEQRKKKMSEESEEKQTATPAAKKTAKKAKK